MTNRNNVGWSGIFSIDYYGLDKLIEIHFLINSIGLISIAMFFGSMLAKLFEPSIYDFYSLFSWARPPLVGIGKLSVFLQYILFSAALIFHYLTFLLISNKLSNKPRVEILRKLNVIFPITIAINAIVLCLLFDKTYLPFLASVYLLNYLFSLCLILDIKFAIPSNNNFLRLILCIISIQFLVIFIPLISEPIKIKNDYLTIPEKTLLKNGRVVDNIDYINQHQIAGLSLFDPRLLAYDRHPQDRERIRLQIDSLSYDAGRVSVESYQEASYSKELIDFVERNKQELTNQVKAGWFLYHHGYNFGPMNALSLGESPQKLTMVYGWLSTVTQSKFLDLLGANNYQGYFKLFFSEYITYFVIYTLGLWLLFRDLHTLLFATILVVSALNFLGLELIQLAPGFNPIRHFFDLPVFYLLLRWLRGGRLIFLLLSCFLAIFSVLWSKDFGLFLCLSLGGAIVFSGIKNFPINIKFSLMGLGLIILALFFYLYPMPGGNPTANYMLWGVGSPQISSSKFFGLLCLVSILLWLSIAIKQIGVYVTLTIAFVLYFLLSLIYFIWYPELHHILGVASVFILLIVLLFYGWSRQYEEAQKSIVLLTLVALVYIPSMVSFYSRNYYQNKVFKSHIVFNWPFETAKVKSTTDPELFLEATSIIRRRSPDMQGIFIISKYDHLLPILANKYSAMPYIELPTNLVSPKEVEVAASAILLKHPRFLFVDSDIEESMQGQVPKQIDPITIKLHLYEEAATRGMVMDGLYEVYSRIANKYELCEFGRLISVYCYKS